MAERRINIVVKDKKAIGWTGAQGTIPNENLNDKSFTVDGVGRALSIARGFYPGGTVFIEEQGRPATLEGLNQGR